MIIPTTAGLELSPAVSAERMLANMRSAISRGLPLATPCKKHGLALSIAGGGPSLADTYRKLESPIATINGSLRWLMERDDFDQSASYFCGVMDAGEHIADMLVAHQSVRYYIASICDPSVFDKLKGCDVRLWHVTPESTDDPDGVVEVLDTAYQGRWRSIGGGCTMGLRWINLGYFLGFRSFSLHGMDSSFRGGSTHAYPDRADAKEHFYLGGRLTRLNFTEQVDHFFEMIHNYATSPHLDDIGVRMFGDGLLQDEWRLFNEKRISVFPQPATACGEEAEGSGGLLSGDENKGPGNSDSGVSGDEAHEREHKTSHRSHNHADGRTVSLASADLPLICCVNNGGKYGPEYVIRLRDGIRRHLSIEHNFVCLTNMDIPTVTCEPLTAGLPGWWAKMEIFRLRRPLYYFDLDVVVTGDLSPLIDSWKGFGAIKDWWQSGINGSVYALTGRESYIWDNFMEKKSYIMDAFRNGGDQGYVYSQMPPTVRTFPPHWFPSYKADHLVGGPPPVSMAVIFHGKPKPADLGGWVADAWRGYDWHTPRSEKEWEEHLQTVGPPGTPADF